MRPELLAKLKQMVSDGLVILGPAPKRSPSLQNYPEADAQVSAMAEAMWGDCSRNHLQYGYGQVFGDGVSLEKVFETLAVEPDFETDADNLLFIHRTLPAGDIYFVSNQSDEAVEFNATFRTAHESVELWNPLTGEIRALPEFSVKDGRTTVPLKLEALESSFIVMRENGVKPEYASNYPALNQDLEIATPWTLTFESGRRGPADKVQADSLFDWTTSADNDIKYFSGKVTYRNNFTLETIPDGDVYVDLGMVMVTAKVRINGKYVGGVWTHPYRLCISDYVKRGNNSIEVEVANNWMNRIIGDLQLKPADRKVWLTVNPWEADSPLQPSGLMGPVKILHLDK
ncbi:MAG: glycoside hydrolase family 2, partial [Bacteroidales bacterium]|nr:glycoside hydrolase family 2 [Bacteroidales bacterium]